MVNQEVVNFIPQGSSYGFDNLMIDLLRAKEKVRIKVFNGYWLDIGRPDLRLHAGH